VVKRFGGRKKVAEVPNAQPKGFHRKAAKGIGWSTGQTIGNITVRILTIVVISRILSPAEVGIVAASMAIISVIALIAQMGVGAALIQRETVSFDHFGTALVMTIVSGLAFAGAVYALAPWLAGLLAIAEAEAALQFLAVIIIVQSVTLVFESLAMRELQFGKVATADFLAMAIGFGAVSIACALAGLGLWSLVAGQIGRVVVKLALVIVLIRPSWRMTVTRKALGDILSFGALFSIDRVAEVSASRLDRSVLGAVLGPEAVGLYTRAQQLLEIAAVATTRPLDIVLFPIMSRVQDSRDKLERGFTSAVALIGAVTLPATLLIVLASKPWIPLILGAHWSGLVPPLQILVLGLFLRSYDWATAVLARSAGRVRERALIQLLYVVLVLGSVALLSPWGLKAVAVGVVASMAVNAVVMTHLIARILGRPILGLIAHLGSALMVTALLGGLFYALYLLLGTWILGAEGTLLFAMITLLSLVGILVLAPKILLTKDLLKVRTGLLAKLAGKEGQEDKL